MRASTLSIVMGAAILSVPVTATAQDFDNGVIRSFSMQDIGGIMEMMGGAMADVSEGPRDTDLSTVLTYEDGTTVDFMAMNCEPGPYVMARACTQFRISKAFEVKDAATASALSAEFDANWYGDHAIGNLFELRRMDWISNGVTPRHLGAAIDEFQLGVARAREEVERVNGR